MRTWSIVLASLLATSRAFAQTPPQEAPASVGPVEAPPGPVAEAPQCQSTDTQICVDKEDLKKFVQLAKERKCLDETTPTFKMDPVTVIIDAEGRVFYTGRDPSHPYKLEMQWCQFDIRGAGKVKIVAALKEPPIWGFRFRTKAYLGYIPTKLFEPGAQFEDGLDVGMMVDVFYYRDFNFNLAAGFRSTGLGIGMDLTKNFGLYAGYAFSWNLKPVHNGLASIYFAF